MNNDPTGEPILIPLATATEILSKDPRFLTHAACCGYADFRSNADYPFERFVEFMLNTGVAPPFHEVDGGDWSCIDLIPEAHALYQRFADAYTGGQWDAFNND